MQFLIQSWNYRDYPFDYCCRKTAQHGWDGLELNYVHIDAAKFEQQFAALKRTADRFGLPIRVLDVISHFADPSRSGQEHEEEVQLYQKLMPVLAGTEIRTINGSVKTGGASRVSPAVFAAAVQRMRRVLRFAEQAGVTMTFETHLKSVGETAAQIALWLDTLDSPAARCCLDLGNLIRAQGAEDCLEAVRALSGRIGHVHVKNLFRLGPHHRFTALAEGEIDYHRVLAEIYKEGYRGTVAMENGGPGSPEYVTREDIRYLRAVLHDIRTGALM